MRGVSIAGLAFVALALAMACGGGDERASETTTPTEQPTATAALDATPPAEIPRTPVPTQSAASLGRTDCPEIWLAYRNETFSICYPPDHYAHLVLPPFDDVFRFGVRLIPGEPVAYTPDGLAVWFGSPDHRTDDCKHFSEYVTEPDSAVVEPYTVGPLSGMSCTALLGSGGQFRGALETSGGSIAFDANATDMDKLDLAKQIVGTVRPEPS